MTSSLKSNSSVTRLASPSPFLHVGPDRIYNPLTDRYANEGEPLYAELRKLLTKSAPSPLHAELVEGGWLVPDGEDFSTRFRLKYVSLEASTVCNQACFFCPVSVAPRAAHAMPMDLYRYIVEQLTAYRDTIEGVFMIGYNEPTVDRHFIEQVEILRDAALPTAVLTNGTGLTRKRVDALLAIGRLRFVSVNLSAVDRERYREQREADHLELVLRNLDYAKDKALAEEMEVVVLGIGDDAHARDYEALRQRFDGSRFAVKYFEVNDRAGHMQVGAGASLLTHQKLRGCEHFGSRPLQHLHITANATCILCCQDYAESVVVGDLNRATVAEVLTGPDMARARRWVYGIEEEPADFICRRCKFALTQ